ncbi:18878_t:CDS:1, partial [Racocetra persica]
IVLLCRHELDMDLDQTERPRPYSKDIQIFGYCLQCCNMN